MSLNIKNILATLLIISGLLVVTGCNGDSGGNGLLVKPDYVDNTPIFPEYQYPNAGGAKKEYLAKLCNNNADILLSGITDDLLPQINGSLDIHSFKIKSKGEYCTGNRTPGTTICKNTFDINSLMISVEDDLNNINRDVFYNYFKHDLKFIACGKARYLDNNYYLIDLLNKIKDTNGFLALDAKDYVLETKFAHFKKFVELVHDNAVNSPNYQKFNSTCNFLKEWSPDKLAYQKVNVVDCRDLFVSYSTKYTKYSGFALAKYDDLNKESTVFDIVEQSFSQTQYDPDYFVVSA